jgi:hypothetical protein
MTKSLLAALRERLGISSDTARLTITIDANLVARLLFWVVVAVAMVSLAAKGTLVNELLKALAIGAILKLRGSTDE